MNTRHKMCYVTVLGIRKLHLQELF